MLGWGLVLRLVHLVLRLVDQLSDRHCVMHAEALLLVHLSHLRSGSPVRVVVWGGLEGCTGTPRNSFSLAALLSAGANSRRT